jgi:hypothetical protein
MTILATIGFTGFAVDRAGGWQVSFGNPDTRVSVQYFIDEAGDQAQVSKATTGSRVSWGAPRVARYQPANRRSIDDPAVLSASATQIIDARGTISNFCL